MTETCTSPIEKKSFLTLVDVWSFSVAHLLHPNQVINFPSLYIYCPPFKTKQYQLVQGFLFPRTCPLTLCSLYLYPLPLFTDHLPQGQFVPCSLPAGSLPAGSLPAGSLASGNLLPESLLSDHLPQRPFTLWPLAPSDLLSP